ncbi:MAG: hypothetical protein H7842_09205 [Gammaproteobacteria bacterium SHHR-1]|uniref:hypothetical protein n=1 Tax=Magnetovirga frankeli TaxID=947516 RepID=UPI001293462E|nr:hypothetical protein D5125_00555 [gamma proteobacterium SS-5]
MGRFFGWVFGLIWLVVGIGGIADNEWLSGGLVFLAGLTSIPRIHDRINAFLRQQRRWRLFRWLHTGVGSWTLAASLFVFVVLALIAEGEQPVGLGDVVGTLLMAGLGFFIFRSIRDKIDELVARAKGVPVQPPEEISEPLVEGPMEAEVRQLLQATQDSDSLRQLDQLKRKFDAFEKMLALKFEEQELTYGRYRQIVEEAYLGCLDNLRQITEAWAGIAGVEVASIHQQLARQPSTAVQQALQQRLQMVAQTQAHIDQLRSSNEMAMTRLDEITIQISRIQTRRGHASMELKDSLKELSNLAQGTQMYDMKR